MNNLGEVGPRRAWVNAEHGSAADRSRAELRRALPNRINGYYLQSNIKQIGSPAIADVVEYLGVTLWQQKVDHLATSFVVELGRCEESSAGKEGEAEAAPLLPPSRSTEASHLRRSSGFSGLEIE